MVSRWRGNQQKVANNFQTKGFQVTQLPRPLWITEQKVQNYPNTFSLKLKQRNRVRRRSCFVQQKWRQSTLTCINVIKQKIKFPPESYVYVKGDMIVHAIVSIFVSSEELIYAIKWRGYVIKHFVNRKCSLPKK